MTKTIYLITLLFSYFSLTVFGERKSHSIYIQSQGLVRGYEDPEDGTIIFHNVPYATAPKGTNRFKAPLPAPVWKGTFDAIDRRIVCPQSDLLEILPKDKVKEEDCLVANIYIPNTNAKNLPVIVNVHGGGFVVGWGDLFKFKKILSVQKVIVVTFNYRLSAHGFLCLGTKDAPGNAGMKDQVALLRWVRDNIKSFGGNPDDVTLHGCSAGSSSVELLMLSKMANGLFKRVVADGGASLLTYTIQIDPVENARKYAKLLGYDGKDDVYSLEFFYKNISYDKLNSVQVMTNPDYILFMTPCVERNVGEEMFLDDSPINILKNGNYHKTPMLYGFSDMEGKFRLKQFPTWKDKMNANFSNFLPGDLHFKDHKEKELVANIVKQFYFGNKLVGEETILSYIKYNTDIFIAYGMIRSANLQLEAGNDQIYLYEYSYFDNDAEYIPYTKIRGADHCAQSIAVMDGMYNFVSVPHDENEIYVSSDMLRMKGIMRKMWGNFIKKGKPITNDSDLAKWAPISCRWSELMSINSTIQVKKSPATKRAIFWDKIYEKYYNVPKPPPIPPPKETINVSSNAMANSAEFEELMRIPVFDCWKKEMNENFSNVLPTDLHFKSYGEKDLEGNMIKEFYFWYKPVDNNTILEHVEYISDITFRCPTLRVVNHLVKAGYNEVYLYQYSYTDENTPVTNTNVRGANHCDQSNIALDGINVTLNRESYFSEDYLSLQSMMRELWETFITNRKPTASGTPARQPVGKNRPLNVVLNKNPEVKGSLLKERCRFWDKIYSFLFVIHSYISQTSNLPLFELIFLFFYHS